MGSQKPFHGPAIFPGSFDPLTNGHVDIVSRSLRIFSPVIVGVLSNSQKSGLFSVEERIELIKATFSDLGDAVQVRSFSGLLVDFARQMNAHVIIRGLRAVSDYEYETQMALMNRKLNDEVETLFMMTRESHSYISSSLVKQVAELGGDVSRLVPPGVHAALVERLGKKGK